MTENIPRSEYPRPEAKRDSWLCLNGKWKFEFDPDHIGMGERWYDQSRNKLTNEIIVPFVFQSELSGINSQAFIDTVWYGKEFILPDEFKSKNILLHFGAVDYECEVFVNSVYVGKHNGGLTPFKFNITKYLLKDNNKPQFISLKVWDPPFDSSIPRGKQTTEKFLSGCSYEKSLGIWQTVWIEPVSSTFLDRTDFYIRPNFEKGLIETKITISGNIKPEYVIEAQAFDGDKPISKIGFKLSQKTGPISSLTADITLEFNEEEISLWSLDNCKIYQMHFRLIDGNSDDEIPLDALECTFAFRKIELKNHKFHLNGKPIYLKQVLYQGYWIDGLWTAPSDELIKKDLELTKEMGYNSLRLHQIVADPRLLYWADMMGILIWGEIANTFGNDARAKDNHIKEWSEIVRRDRNHPSIIMWTPINESWGTGNLNEEQNYQWLRSLYYWTKAMDPTRPVNTNDGWENPDTSDIISIHDYCFADSFANRYPIEKPDNYTEFFDGFKPNRFTIIPGLKTSEKPVMITEWGGWGMYFEEPNRKPDRKEAWGYQGILYKSFNEILDLYEDFIDELVKRKDWISGHCYTEFNDQYQEVNGMLTFERHPKGDLNRLKRINEKLHY